MRGFGGKPRPESAQSDPGPHPWSLQAPARLLSSALRPTVAPQWSLSPLHRCSLNGMGWFGSSPGDAAGAGLCLKRLPFLLPTAQGLLPPWHCQACIKVRKGFRAPGSRPTPPRGAHDPEPFRPARLAHELLISSSGKPSLSADVIPVLGVIRTRHVCRSATCHALIRHSVCSQLEGKINLDVADLEPQVTCLQL